MCGIAGFYSNENNTEERLYSITKGLNHRGPDACDLKVFGNYGVGHTRLSIIDLNEVSNQPFQSINERYYIVYNGEIYNYKEIRKELESIGSKFKSNSDTEVILNGFIHYGEEVVIKLNGMFSFIIYDKEEKSFFIARDRFGIKPLFYYKKDNNFWFCSELKPINKNFDLKTSIEGAVMLLLLGSIPGNRTIYSDVYKFPSGHYGTLQNGDLNIHQFYSSEFEPKINSPTSEIITSVKNYVESSIKKHLISDAPIGTFLSGGIDSSILTAVSAKEISKLKTISVSFEEKKFSEAYYQKLVSEQYKTEHYDFLITKNVFQDQFLNYLSIVDQPNIDGFNTYLASIMAKKAGLKTILAGQGADELFYSYNSFLNARKYRKKHFGLASVCILKKLKSLIRTGSIPKEYLLYQKIRDLILYLPNKQLFSLEEISKILRIDIESVSDIITDEFSFLNTNKVHKYEDKVSLFEQKLYLEGQLLAKDDFSSMATSLEIRIPFLENDLVNYVNKINPDTKYKNLIPKYLLAKAFEDDLPNELLYRKKKGFSLPYGQWMNGILDLIDQENLYKDIFRNNEIGWTKYMSILMLNKFNLNLDLCI